MYSFFMLGTTNNRNQNYFNAGSNINDGKIENLQYIEFNSLKYRTYMHYLLNL